MSYKYFVSKGKVGAVVIAVMLGGLIFSVNRTEAQTANLLSNYGFEAPGSNKEVALGWHPFGIGYKRVEAYRSGAWGVRLDNNDFTQMSGLSQRIDLQQTAAKPVVISGYVKGENIENGPAGYFGASLYTEIHLKDGSIVYWNSVGNYGTFNWRRVGFNTGTLAAINQPIDHIFIVPIMAKAKGRAFFDDISVQEHDPAQGAVTIMFDDGELSTYIEGRPAMARYGFKGSASIITSEVGQDIFMSWEQLQELQAAGWEMVSHGLSHADLTNMSNEKMEVELRESKRVLEENGLIVNNFALPFGVYNMDILATGAEWYRSLRAYEQGGNPQGTLPWDVKVRGVTTATTPDTIQDWIDEARTKGLWQVIVFHTVAETGDDAYHTTPVDLDAMLKVVSESGLDVVTYNEGLNRFGGLSDARLETPELINDSLSLAGLNTSLDSADPRAPAGVFTIESTFTNTSADSITDIFFDVSTLTGGHLLLNADGDPGGVGSTVLVPGSALGSDEILSPGESFTQVFEIGLGVRSRFEFLVDIFTDKEGTTPDV